MEEPVPPHENHLYSSMIGGLPYLATCASPDIKFSVSSLAQHFHYPTTRHILLAKLLLRYLNGTKNNGLFFTSTRHLTPESLRADIDADWGGNIDTRRSTTGVLIA